MANIKDCKLIKIPRKPSDKGSLSFLESESQIPFNVKRVYFTYDIPSGAERGGHAHRNLHQLIIAVSGSFNVLIDDGNEQENVFLNAPNKGLLVTPGIWRELNSFSTGAVVLVLASEKYDADDYIYDYEQFESIKW